MKLLLIDKDGTLVNPKSGAKFVQAPWDQQPIDRTPEAIQRYASEGWRISIISNQGGVAAGHKTLEQAIEEMRFCLELFPSIGQAFLCPDFEGNECWQVWDNCDEQHRIWHTPNSYQTWDLGLQGQYRKPNPGMLRLAIDIHNAEEVLYVGDRGEDEGAAMAAGVRFMWAEEWRNGQKQN